MLSIRIIFEIIEAKIYIWIKVRLYKIFKKVKIDLLLIRIIKIFFTKNLF
jgi:hypothetical protein